MTRSQKLYEIRERIINILSKLAGELDATVYLFGSYAKGTHTIDSDVDIVVVSEMFKGVDPVERVALVRLKLPADIAFEIIALTPEEMTGDSTLIKEISREWIKITKNQSRHQPSLEEC
ncbi:MAG: nucleotidyltransferase domain-containing protein [Candidatus Caldarchaeum sp.]